MEVKAQNAPSKADLDEWLGAVGYGGGVRTALAGDVSTRRYYRLRLRGRKPSILAVYPADGASTANRFLATTELFRRVGIDVPAVLAAEPTRGLILLEDLGDETLFSFLDRPPPDETPAELAGQIEAAAEQIEVIQKLEAEAVSHLNPPLDAARLLGELEPAVEFLLTGFDEVSPASIKTLRAFCERLCAGAAAPQLVPAHRDFMVRNLMAFQDRLVVIDHQDTCLAPPMYDLASLLNDSLFAPAAFERRLLDRYAPRVDELANYRRCVVQRTLKASATFVRFALRGRDDYLWQVPILLARAARAARDLPEAELVGNSWLDSWTDGRAVEIAVHRALAAGANGASEPEC